VQSAAAASNSASIISSSSSGGCSAVASGTCAVPQMRSATLARAIALRNFSAAYRTPAPPPSVVKSNDDLDPAAAAAATTHRRRVLLRRQTVTLRDFPRDVVADSSSTAGVDRSWPPAAAAASQPGVGRLKSPPPPRASRFHRSRLVGVKSSNLFHFRRVATPRIKKFPPPSWSPPPWRCCAARSRRTRLI